MTMEGVLESKSIFDKCCLELKNTLENMWGGTNIWNFEVWPLSHRTLLYTVPYTILYTHAKSDSDKSIIYLTDNC